MAFSQEEQGLIEHWASKNRWAVSRGTLVLLDRYIDLLLEYNQKVNLVSRQTSRDELMNRHILDCAQLVSFLPDSWKSVIDFGSGGGLPGVVLAILCPTITFHLVESVRKKADFLSLIQKELALSNVVVHPDRLEKLPSLEVDGVISRAVCGLKDIFKFSYTHLKQDGEMLLLKGKTFPEEVKEAAPCWTFISHQYPSATGDGVIAHLAKIKER